MILFKRCCLCSRLVLCGMYSWLSPKPPPLFNPHPPPVVCGDCKQRIRKAELEEEREQLRRMVTSINALGELRRGEVDAPL